MDVSIVILFICNKLRFEIYADSAACIDGGAMERCLLCRGLLWEVIDQSRQVVWKKLKTERGSDVPEWSKLQKRLV